MADARVIELAADPNLIPGVYNACDQWCDYCPVTARCLSFRWQLDRPACVDPRAGQMTALRESMARLRDFYEAEGLQPPEDMLRLLRGDAPVRVAYMPADDPLERMAQQYMIMAGAFLASLESRWSDNPMPRRPHGPTPLDIVVFDHLVIAIKIGRAIASDEEATRTRSAAARLDADRSAKVALVSIDRSDEALQVLALDDTDPRIEFLRRHLARLQRNAEARFPAARSTVRPGLDDRPVR
jgi:hypothetical protein